MENPFSFIKLFNKLQSFLDAHSDAAVARGLKITPQALLKFKKNGKFPADLIVQFCIDHHLSVDSFVLDIQTPIDISNEFIKSVVEKTYFIYNHGSEDQKALLHEFITLIHDKILDKQRGKGSRRDYQKELLASEPLMKAADPSKINYGNTEGSEQNVKGKKHPGDRRR
jgi:hypothetical protein